MAPTDHDDASLPVASKVRSRSSGKKTQRKKVEAEVRARTARDKDVFALKMRLLSEAASETLMVAARGLFQPEDYEAVVEERGLEGLCGYPPCSNAALGDQGKKWSINMHDGTVARSSTLGNFCSVACRRASAKFIVCLEPEPSYVRSETAVAVSRAAIAGKDNSPAKESAAREESDQAKSEEKQVKAAPKIRQKAVVKFSRANQTYTVQCDEYDGSGGIPGLPSAECELPRNLQSEHGVSGENKTEWIKRVVSTPIIERDDTHTTQPSIASEVVADSKEILVESGTDSLQSQTEATTEKLPQSVEQEKDDACDDDLVGHFEPLEFPFEILPKTVSVRVWGILASWVHERARDALWRGIAPACNEQDDRPDHMTRHQLLSDVLLQRVPGDLSFIAPRLLQVVSAFQLHEALPPVTDVLLYDLLAALMIRAVLRADVSRKIRPYSQREETIACRQVEHASAQCGMQEDEFRWLETQLDFLYWS